MSLFIVIAVIFIVSLVFVGLSTRVGIKRTSAFLDKVVDVDHQLTFEPIDTETYPHPKQKDANSLCRDLDYKALKLRLELQNDGMDSDIYLQLAVLNLNVPDYFNLSISFDDKVMRCIVDDHDFDYALNEETIYPDLSALLTFIDEVFSLFAFDHFELNKTNILLAIKNDEDDPERCMTHVKHFADIVCTLVNTLPPTANAFWSNVINHKQVDHDIYHHAMIALLPNKKALKVFKQTMVNMNAYHLFAIMEAHERLVNLLEQISLPTTYWLTFLSMCHLHGLTDGPLLLHSLERFEAQVEPVDLKLLHQGQIHALNVVLTMCLNRSDCLEVLPVLAPDWIRWMRPDDAVLWIERVRTSAPQHLYPEWFDITLASVEINDIIAQDLAQVFIQHINADPTLLSQQTWMQTLAALFTYANEFDMAPLRKFIEAHAHPYAYTYFKTLTFRHRFQKHTRDKFLSLLEERYRAHHKIGGLSLSQAKIRVVYPLWMMRRVS